MYLYIRMYIHPLELESLECLARRRRPENICYACKHVLVLMDMHIRTYVHAAVYGCNICKL